MGNKKNKSSYRKLTPRALRKYQLEKCVLMRKKIHRGVVQTLDNPDTTFQSHTTTLNTISEPQSTVSQTEKLVQDRDKISENFLTADNSEVETAKNSSEEDIPDDNADANEQSSSFQEPQTLVVKVEPSEYYNEEPEIYGPAAVKVEVSDIEVNEEQAYSDPLSLGVKTERSPRSDVLDNTIETLALTETAATKRKGRKVPRSDVTSTRSNETLSPTEPAATKRKGRKIPRSDVTSTRQHTQGEPSTSAASSSVQLTEVPDESSLFGDIEMKTEEIEIHEEGVS